MNFEDIVLILSQRGVLGTEDALVNKVNVIYDNLPEVIRAKHTNKYIAIAEFLSTKPELPVEIPQNAADQLSITNQYLMEIEIDYSLFIIEAAFYLTQDDRYERFRLFGPIIQHLCETISPWEVKRAIHSSLGKFLKEIGMRSDDATAIGRVIYRTYERNRNLEHSSMREESFGTLNYYRFIAEHLLSFPDNVQRINEFLKENIKKDSSMNAKHELEVLIRKDWDTVDWDIVDKIYERIPEATREMYSSKYTAVLDFYHMYKEEITKSDPPTEGAEDVGDVMALFAKDGISGEEAVKLMDKIYELIPEATRDSYPNKYKAVVDFYPMWKSMHE